MGKKRDNRLKSDIVPLGAAGENPLELFDEILQIVVAIIKDDKNS
jgi:hypothetical protein